MDRVSAGQLDANVAVDAESDETTVQLNQSEIDELTERTIERVEKIRELEFKEDVDVEVISVEEFADRNRDAFADTSESEATRENVKWEAMMMVNESTDATELQQANAVEGPRGYYDPEHERVVLVVDDEASPELNELVLAHELVHALQDQHFDISDRFHFSPFERPPMTQDELNAKNGIVEGDAVRVEQLYLDRCSEEWECQIPDRMQADDDELPDRQWGMYLVSLQPYSDGPNFVNHVESDHGWEGVNEIYENPPASSHQVIEPEAYPDDEPATIEFTDRSSSDWELVEGEGDQPDYESVGQAGAASMLFYPYYDSDRDDEAPVIPVLSFLNLTDSGELSEYRPVKYANNPYVSGWNGDALYPYVMETEAGAKETAYVWKSNWETERDAERWLDGYTELLNYHGGEESDENPNVFVIPDDNDFAGAYYIDRSGDTVIIANSPTEEELPAVYDASAVNGERPSEDEPVDGGGSDDSSDGLSGFGIAVTVVALITVASSWRRLAER
ncbi:hypothetical protein B1756_14690 [Natrarchaeobaculum aegyptiacum]|uniref:PGF-CTERM sorting domain-containing protein n=1 Tax=Natrarchaeobaculum aegyptiacum TaxID=745377 RepID=A0A2Z2HYI7_9EURY|nr:hypothetical protein B1756_14690 [Natrarchaeobaculum aegyptiacum]